MMVWHYFAASAHLRSVRQSHLRRVMTPLLYFKDIFAGSAYIFAGTDHSAVTAAFQLKDSK